MAEAGEFAVDAPVAPVGVLPGEPEDEFADLGLDRRPTAFRGRWLGPVLGDESAVPADHRRGLDDEEHLCEASTVEHPAERGEDRAVGLGEVRTLDLTLKNDELMAHEDLSVALITGRGTPNGGARRRVS
ncbi:MAG: hypothetical protein V9E94_03620 [Microthrixaceae bacterium]